ncbi:MAG TPA: mycothiol synthase [Nocardioides sp.]|nr:mycothiol synthase [Nocardioides sp.]
MTTATPVHPVPADAFDPAPVAQVADAATQADGVEPLNEAALLALRHHGLADGSLWLSGRADEPDGFAWVHGGEVDLVVVPAARGRGVGAALAAAVAEALPEVTLSAWSHGNHPAAARLAQRLGWDRVRDLWVMRRPLTGLPPLDDAAARARAAGVAVRTFRPGEDEEAFLALNAEAFAHHPEQGGLTRADLERRTAEPWFDPAGFFLAERAGDAGGLLGFHWTKVHDTDPPVGEVYVVGVSPGAQGIGLGRLLTLTGLHHLAQRELGEVLLYVESDNAAAIATYSGLGFTHQASDTHVMYRSPA